MKKGWCPLHMGECHDPKDGWLCAAMLVVAVTFALYISYIFFTIGNP